MAIYFNEFLTENFAILNYVCFSRLRHALLIVALSLIDAYQVCISGKEFGYDGLDFQDQINNFQIVISCCASQCLRCLRVFVNM